MMRMLTGMLLVLLPALAQADALQRLQDFFAATRSMRAEFHQVVLDRDGRKLQEVTGTMQLQRPGKFRWDYRKPYVQLIVGDGERVWLYDPDLAQVTVRSLDRALGSTPAALLAGSDDIGSHFELSEVAGQNRVQWISAIPKARDSGFDKVMLGFVGDKLTTMQVQDSFGQVTMIDFTKVETNPALPPASFRFIVPAGTDVLGE